MRSFVLPLLDTGQEQTLTGEAAMGWRSEKPAKHLDDSTHQSLLA
jgi:hypothetical protein